MRKAYFNWSTGKDAALALYYLKKNSNLKVVNELKRDGYTDCGFGDIFLEDLRTYREQQLKGINCHFPLWKKNTTKLLSEFISQGYKAVVICINGDLLDASFVGRELDYSFLNDLPDTVDPCGENGEFHTFCYDGPIFSNPVKFEFGEKIRREYKNPDGDTSGNTTYWFIDLK